MSNVIASAQKEQEIASREAELKRNLREIRTAIANYRRACMMAEVGPLDRRVDDGCYSPTLEVLVKGVTRPGDNVKLVFLKRIPNDPMTGKADWGLRSAQDPPDSTTWGGQNVANVYSKSESLDCLAGAKSRYLLSAKTQLPQNLIRMLAQHRGALSEFARRF